MRRAAAVLACLALLAAAGGRRAMAGVDRTILVDGVERSYRIHVPSSWDRVRPVPVLFVFHGAGSDAESMVAATGFDAAAEASPMVVVYPRAPAHTRRYDVDPPAGKTSADVRFVDALLARLRGRFPVDGRRVFATGFSNGAALCYRLAAERSHAFAAVAPVAGYEPRSLSRPRDARPVPLLHLHGTADRRVPAADARFAAWAAANGATGEPSTSASRSPEGHGLRRIRFAGPTPASDTHLVLVEGAGHEWSGGPGGTVSREVLAFLLAHPRAEAAPAPAAGPAAAR
jgi:polyhydroxybutyrate depolymerase